MWRDFKAELITRYENAAMLGISESEAFSKIEKQEMEFINKLQQMQKAYELNLENIVNNNKELNNQLLEKLHILEESFKSLQTK